MSMRPAFAEAMMAALDEAGKEDQNEAQKRLRDGCG